MYLDSTPLIGGAGIAAHVALFMFIVTEAFGPVARERGRAARIVARGAFFTYAMLIVGSLITLVWRYVS